MRILKVVILVVAILFAFVNFACDSQNQSETAKNVEPEKNARTEISEKTPEVLNGAVIYQANCAKCHSENGKGTDKGISFLKGHALNHSEEDFINQVKNGEKDKMPAFKEKLKEDEIRAVVKYVREEIQKNADKNADENHRH